LGSVMAAKCLVAFEARASLRSAVTSRSASPDTTAKRNTCPQSCLTRWAVSMASRASSLRRPWSHLASWRCRCAIGALCGGSSAAHVQALAGWQALRVAPGLFQERLTVGRARLPWLCLNLTDRREPLAVSYLGVDMNCTRARTSTTRQPVGHVDADGQEASRLCLFEA